MAFRIIFIVSLASELAWGQFPVDNLLPLMRTGRFENDEVFQRVLDTLTNTSNYDNRIRPNATSGFPTRVAINIFIRDISSIDEMKFEFTTDIDLTQKWTDPRLEFRSRTSSKEETFITARGDTIKKIWVPDIYFENEKKGSFHNIVKPNIQMRIYSNGTVVYIVRMSLILSCFMQLNKYPMDTQTCEMKLGSYSYTSRDLDFYWGNVSPIVTETDLNNPKFKLLHVGAQDCFLDRDLGNYSCLAGKLKLKREFSFHVIQTYVPTILLVGASWMGFWIDSNAVPARVAIGVTTLLTIVSMSTAVRLGLPPVSYVKAIDVWMFVCILYIFGAMIEFAIMNHATTRLKQKKGLLPDSLARCLAICTKKEEKETIGKSQSGGSMITLSSDGTISKVGRSSAGPAPPSEDHIPKHMDIDGIARYLFPISFFLFFIIYWAVYAS